jgi:hypothetical protein
MLIRWWARDGCSGKLLGFLDTADIDYALRRDRKRFYHDVTVDNLTPRELLQPRTRT